MSRGASGAGVGVAEDGYPRGSRLGLPAVGPGSVAGWNLRIAALVLDWALGYALALVLVRDGSLWDPTSTARLLPLLVWFVVVLLATGLTGASFGQHLLGLRVIRLDRRPVGLWRALVRTALIALVVPPLVVDRDGRGLHDLAVGTVVVRGPGTRGSLPSTSR